MKKAVLWIIIWALFLVIGSALSVTHTIDYIIHNGTMPIYPPYNGFQKVLLYIFFPFALVPSAAISCYYAVKGNVKILKAITLIILIQHIIILVGLITQLFT